jgi:membrane-bound metal-dependent hydrolase YbcI (DUF457 family)
MGPGHFGVALAAKPLTSKTPLWVLLAGSELLDLLSFVLIPAGVERMAAYAVSWTGGIEVLSKAAIPWSHSLIMSLVWTILAGGVVWLLTRDRRSGLVMGAVVFSHWLLDFLVHTPDLPLLLGGSPEVGLGLWGSGPGLVIAGALEIALLGTGLAIYLRDRKKRKIDQVSQRQP